MPKQKPESSDFKYLLLFAAFFELSSAYGERTATKRIRGQSI
jgi:hypothetical protein